ncbi:MAG: hypothetical protein KKG59_01510 [Nanoarchaeota archaeon]|nr:hypothetical protein [Nanoarchaeota archaeon]
MANKIKKKANSIKRRGEKVKKNVNLPKLSNYRATIEFKKKGPAKKKVLAEVLVGAAIASGITFAVKKMIDEHHKREQKQKMTSKRITKKAPAKRKVKKKAANAKKK